MQKFLLLMLSLIVSVGVSAETTSVWSGSFEFAADGNSWHEVAAEKFADMKLGDKIVVTVSEITNPDGWAQINLAGKDPWTTVPGTNWGDVKVGENKYEITDDAVLASIKAGGLGIQGKYFVMTGVSIETEGEGPVPTPKVSVWSDIYEFNAAGDGWQEVAADKFADMKLGDKIVVTVSEITNPDGWAQINLAGKDPWMTVPGTNWGDVKVGENTYEIADADVLASIKTGGLGIQGKYFKMTDISIIVGGTTGISAVSGKQEGKDSFYSLSGMKVINPRKGIFVKGGKKYIRR